jgi:hypothetical protein
VWFWDLGVLSPPAVMVVEVVEWLFGGVVGGRWRVGRTGVEAERLVVGRFGRNDGCLV